MNMEERISYYAKVDNMSIIFRVAARFILMVTIVGAGVFVPSLSASAGEADSSCPSGDCVWSGDNYTGTKVVLAIPGFGKCFTATGDGFDAIRSANVTGATYFLDFYDNADCTGAKQVVTYNSVPVFDPPKLGMVATLIRW